MHRMNFAIHSALHVKELLFSAKSTIQRDGRLGLSQQELMERSAMEDISRQIRQRKSTFSVQTGCFAEQSFLKATVSSS